MKYSKIISQENEIISLQKKLILNKENFLIKIKSYSYKLIKKFNKHNNINIKLDFTDVFHVQQFYSIENVFYYIYNLDIKREKWFDDRINYDSALGYYYQTNEDLDTPYNIKLIKNFPHKKLKKLIKKLEKYFLPNIVKFNPASKSIKFKYDKISSFWDIELFLQEKLELLYIEKVYYTYQYGDESNFYFVKNSKNQIQIFFDENTSEFVQNKIENEKVLVGEIEKLNIFFNEIWRDGDNFEFVEKGNTWKQKILDSWK